MVQNAPLRELRRQMLRPFLGPRSSSSERLKRCCMFCMADCGLGWAAALPGIERLAGCTLGAMQCKDPSR
eukprot:7341487-Alexandrium_andersonii.AAC.1